MTPGPSPGRRLRAGISDSEIIRLGELLDRLRENVVGHLKGLAGRVDGL